MVGMLNSSNDLGDRSPKYREEGPSPDYPDQCDRAPSEAETILRRFNPALVGFGIVGPTIGGGFVATDTAGAPPHALPLDRSEECK
jgi:hypothetical protein